MGGKHTLEILRELLEIRVSDRQNKFVVSFSSIIGEYLGWEESRVGGIVWIVGNNCF